MNCLQCSKKSCRSAVSCGAESFDQETVLETYRQQDEKSAVKAAARLVDGGRAGTLSRIEELVEFSKEMGYRHIGLAYCYGMEDIARCTGDILKESGFRVTGISCTVGALRQDQINQNSSLPGVSCDPLGQAAQLKSQRVDLAVLIGLCLGHDMLFTRHYSGDMTTLVVKDRPFSHDPVKGIRKHCATVPPAV